MVTISIMMLLSVIILVRNSSFNGAVLLRSQAYELAFTLRQAQLLAVSGNNEGGVAGNEQRYGVTFSRTAETYQIFHDSNVNGLVDSGEEYGPVKHIDPRFEIRDFTNVGGNSEGGGSNEMNVYFTRPNFDAKFKRSGGSVPVSSNIYIDISKLNDTASSTGDVRRVQVTSTGQISVITY